MSSYKVIEMRSVSPEFEPYKALVLACWLRGLQHGSQFFKLIDSKTYWEVYAKVILNLLRRPECMVRIAVLEDEPDTAIGWSAFEGGAVHFVYVRKSARRIGVARELTPKDIRIFTHMTAVGNSIWKKKFKQVKFNPF